MEKGISICEICFRTDAFTPKIDHDKEWHEHRKERTEAVITGRQPEDLGTFVRLDTI